jgi:hypothetical protein
MPRAGKPKTLMVLAQPRKNDKRITCNNNSYCSSSFWIEWLNFANVMVNKATTVSMSNDCRKMMVPRFSLLPRGDADIQNVVCR